mgnify:CR=1 FL=1
MSFDLQEALNGAPVKLRNGNKAFIFKNIQNTPIVDFDVDYPLIGMLHNHPRVYAWSLSGKISLSNDCAPGDIVGMWEEPELTSEQVLEKAYEDDLLVLCDGNPDLPLKVIAKAKNGEFVVQPEDTTIQPWLANLTMEWFFVKDSAPKSNTITVTLPKPFNPKVGNAFYFISDSGEVLVAHFDPGYISHVMAKDTGRCFRTESDAQAWLDAMKSALDD